MVAEKLVKLLKKQKKLIKKNYISIVDENIIRK
jgi:hypothetical protein